MPNTGTYQTALVHSSFIYFIYLTYMIGTAVCAPIKIILVITFRVSIQAKFGVNRKFHVSKTRVYRFDFSGRCGTI